jgi:hypothetical protein
MRSRVVAVMCALLTLRCASPANPATVLFAYADTSGSRLLALDLQDVDGVAPDSMETAICGDGRVRRVRHLGFQKRAGSDDGRQSASNFNRDEGHLFAIEREGTTAGDTCLLAPSTLLRAFPIVPNDLTAEEREARRQRHRLERIEAEARGEVLDGTSRRPIDPSARIALDRIQREKARVPALFWLLHRAGASQEVAAVEFEAIGGDRLASVVLAEPGRLFFFDMPTSDAHDCWRVDDGCRFDPSGMDVVLFGHAGERLVLLTWWGPEGQSIALLQARGGKLVELRRAYRYHAPV